MPLTPEQKRELLQLRDFLVACKAQAQWADFEGVHRNMIEGRMSEMVSADEYSEYKRGIIRGLLMAYEIPQNIIDEANGTEQDT